VNPKRSRLGAGLPALFGFCSLRRDGSGHSPDYPGALALCCVFSFCLAACAGSQRDLRAASALYADARYEAVQAWLAQLRDDYPDLTGPELAHFHYLSGMTAYRLSQPDEALHELALAAHAAREQPNALGSEQLALLYRTLEELAEKR
jgi:hypothetical protein